MSNELTKNYSIFAVIAMIGLILGGYYVFSNSWPGYQASVAQTKQIKADNQRLEEALASLNKFLEDYEEEKTNAANVNLVLPAHNVDMANFVSSMSQIARASGIVLSNLQIENNLEVLPAEPNTIQIQNIGFTASGSYLTFKDFLLRLESHYRLVDINHVTLASSDSSSPGTPVLQYNVKLRTYFQQ